MIIVFMPNFDGEPHVLGAKNAEYMPYAGIVVATPYMKGDDEIWKQGVNYDVDHTDCNGNWMHP